MASPTKAPVATPAVVPAQQPVVPIVPGRAVALNRAGKPIQRVAAEAGVDQFHIPRNLPPPGWSWEWKEESVLGEVRHGVQAQQAQVGWEPVMYESYPGIFAPEFDHDGKKITGPVRRGGLMLKERPMALTDEAKMDERRKALERVGQARNQYSRLDPRAAGATTAEWDQTAQRASYINQSQERIDIPAGSTFQAPID